MNTGSPQSPQRVGETDFLRKVEDFRKKVKEKPTKGDIDEFYKFIKTQSIPKGSHTATTVSDRDQNLRILKALKGLKDDLGTSKFSAETAAQGMPYPVIQKVIAEIDLYVKEQEEEAKKVGRKPSSGAV